MSDEFGTRLRLQLREAAVREERRGPVATRFVRARRGLPDRAPLAAALATVLLAVAVALGALALRGEPEPAAPKVTGSFRVAAALSSLAPGYGAVWTADPVGGEILRIDPATRRVVARIRVGAQARVATGAGGVWAIVGDLQNAGATGPVRLLRIDPATDRVVARIPMRTPAGAPFGPVELRIDDGVIWAVGLNGALRIDARRNAVDRHLALADDAGAPQGIVIDGDVAWVLNAGGRLRQHDATTGRVIGEQPVRARSARLLAVSARGLTVLVGKNRLAQLERVSAGTVWRTSLGADIGGILLDGGALWVQYAGPPTSSVSASGGQPDRLVRLDAGTGRRRGQVDLPERGVAALAKVGPEIWVAGPSGTITVVR